MATPYNVDFFKRRSNGSQRAAECIVPLVLKRVKAASVVDIGCGTGAWLAVFKKYGTQSVLGLDGDYVDRAQLQVDISEFKPCDLRSQLKETRRFDLAISLEVAEHLPKERACSFIHDLTLLADVVLFSAAIPFQGGTSHLNEQWQHYWQGFFETYEYTAFDVVRPMIWKNQEVPLWYRQNTLLYANKDGLKRCSFTVRSSEIISIVHPEHYLAHSDPTLIDLHRIGVKRLFHNLPRLIWESFIARIRNSKMSP